jgi:hypothetical protein
MTRRISSGVAAEIAGQGSTTTVVDEAAGVRVHRPAGVIVQASSGAMIVSRVASPDARVVRVAGDKLPAPGNICEDIAAELRLADDRLAGDLATARTELGADVALAHADASAARTDAAAARSEVSAARTELGADVALAHADASAARTDAAAARSEVSAARTELGADVALAHADASAARSEAAAVVARMDDLDPIVTIIQSDVAGAGAAIVTEQGVRAAADEAISASVDALTTRVGAAESGLTTEQTVRSTETGALSNNLTALTTRVSAAESGLTTEQTVRSTETGALSNNLTALTTRVSAAESGLTTEQTVRSTETGALSNNLTALTTRVSAAESGLTTEQTVRSTETGALSNNLTALTTRVSAAESGLTTEQTVRSTETGALSNNLTALTARLYYDVAGCFNNSNFGDWSDGATVPAGLSAWNSVGSGRAINRVAGRRSPWAMELVAPDAMDMGVGLYSRPSLANANWVGPSGLRYYTLTIEVELIAGDFQSAGWYIAGYNGDTVVSGCSKTSLFTIDVPAPVVGKTYTISRVIDLCAGGATEAAAKTATGYNMHIFANWSGFGGAYSAKTLRIHQWHIRPATIEETRTFNVGTEISAAVQTETTARASADTTIANNLTALTTRVSAAESGLTTEQTVRSTETGALSNNLTALTTRVSAAESGLTTEQTVRSTETGALSNNLTALTTRVSAAESGLTTEQTVRSTETGALSNNLTALTTRVSAAESGLTTEQTVRSTETGALSNNLTALTAAVNTNAQTGAFDAALAYNFDTTAEGWTASGGGLTVAYGVLTITSTGTDPIAQSPAGLSIPGATNRYVRARIRRTAGAGWDGTVMYVTAGHAASTSYKKTISAPTAALNEWTVVEWDMHALTAGGTDWRDSTITRLRLDLGNSAADVFEVDWIAVGRYGAGGGQLAAAVQAGLTTEQTVRSTETGALSNNLTALTARLYYDVAGCFNNSNFGDWSDGATVPAGLSAWNSVGSGRAINRVAGRRSPWAMELVAPDAMDMGVGLYSRPSLANANWVGPSGLRYYTLTIEVELIAGDFQSAGWYIAGYNGDTVVSGCSKTSLFTIDVPAPVVGKTYTISRVIDLCAGGATEAAAKTATGYNMHIFANWSGFGGAYSAKTLRIHQWHIRPATIEETRTFNVGTEISAAVQTETTARVTETSSLAQSVTTLQSQQSSTTATLTQTAQTVDGLSLRYGIQGSINGQTGGYQLTGVLRNDGTVAYNLEITANVVISGDLLIEGTVRNAGLEDLAASNSLAASSPTGSNTTGDVTLYVRKSARVKISVCHNGASPQVLQIYIGGALYRTVEMDPWVTHSCIAPLTGGNVLINGAASASSTQSGYYPGSAFDANAASAWFSGALPTAAAPVYLTYQLPAAKSITQYAVTARAFAGYAAPRDWVLQGSSNGSAWTDIHTVTTPGFSGNSVETKTFTVAATAGFSYFRLEFTTNAGYKIAVCEFAAYETAPGDQNIVFKATNSSVGATTSGFVEMIVEEFSK